MNVLVVESPAKAKTINKYLGSGYKVLASFGHIRDLPPKDGSVKPDEDFAMIWEVDDRRPEADQGHRRRAQRRRQADPGHRPGPRGRGDLLACAGSAEAEAARWASAQVERVVFNAITTSAVLEAIAHPRADQRGAGRRLSGAPRARLSGRLHPVAGAVAQAAGRALGGPRAIGGAAPDLRARRRDRGVQGAGILDRRCRSARAGGHRSPPTSPISTARSSTSFGLQERSRRQARRRCDQARNASRSARSRPSRSSAIPRRPSSPRPCSRKPRASWASPPSAPCRSRSSSMKASISAAKRSASSPICVPTACTMAGEAIAEARAA